MLTKNVSELFILTPRTILVNVAVHRHKSMDLPYISNANYISTYRDRLRVSLYKNLREG